MVVYAILSYAVSFAVIVLAIFGILLFFKKTKRQFKIGSFLIGILAFIGMFIGMYFLMIYAFSEDSIEYMNALMDPNLFKVIIGVLFFVIVGLLRFWLVNLAYFNRENTEGGLSFMAGYGLSGGILCAVYTLFMFVYVLITSLSTKYTGMGEDSTMVFENSTKISVMQPLYGHIVISVVFAVYCFIMLVTALFMDNRARHPYKFSRTLLMYVITALAELLVCCFVLFATTSVNIIVICVISVLCAALCTLSLVFLYKFTEEQEYTKQFE